MIVYHYAGCSTCKKALTWLAARGVAVTKVDLVQTPPSADVLRDLWTRSGRPLDKLFNVSGQSYRDGGFKDRLKTMSDADKLAALAADGKLVKRPIFDAGDAVLVGFDEAAWSEALG
ncbi:MAG: Spx/MgsR family RNA polymerase-binding regulatory protein [Deltaproteobacteria bacterium]|nr:Spx/MgsR family RNA polymerase-binding regulatory protein [Deltaproteobacteria bacterium]